MVACAVVLFVFISITATAIYAQETTTKRVSKVEEWIGERVIFFPMWHPLLSDPKDIEYWCLHQFTQYSYSKEGSPRLSYQEYQELAGKTAVIIEAKRKGNTSEVVLKIEDSNKLVYTKVYGDNLDRDNIGYISEMNEAKKYVGKTVWFKAFDPWFKFSTYDPEKDKSDVISIKNLEKLTIIKVEWAWCDYNPLRFYFKTKDGKIGWWDCRIWDTPSSSLITCYGSLSNLFNEYWYFKNPYKLHPNWSQRAWKAIEEREVYIGMTKEMVLTSWGEPKDINRTVTEWGVHEQWVYGSQYLYFDNGELTTFQD